MNNISQDALLMALKIAIVPVMLISILWRNRREKLRRTETATKERETRAVSTRRDVVALSSLDIGGLETALDRVENGDCLVSPRNEPLTAAMLRRSLASALMDAGRLDEAEQVIGDVTNASPALMLCAARLRALSGEDAAARKLVSTVADRKLEEMQAASRGLRSHLAEMLAETIATPRKLDSLDTRLLSEAGPLELLFVADRKEEALALAADLAAHLEKALQEGAGDPEFRVDGMPKAAVQKAHAALHAFSTSGAEATQSSTP